MTAVCTQYLTLAGLRERERIRRGEDGRPAFYGSFEKKLFQKKLSKTFGGYCDPRYSFHWIGKSDTVYVFEAPIDMLSFISMYQKDWMEHSYVALCGVAEHALLQLLEDVPHLSKIALCLDHDKAGIEAGERIKKRLSERGYRDVFPLFSCQKDWNEDLQALQKPPPEFVAECQTVTQMM